MSYTLHRGAELDLAEAARFYRKEGGARLSRRFLDEFERVAELVQGFETPFGLELLSTVHWVCTRNWAGSADDVW